MQHYKYIIIGGGMTADSAVKGIRSIDEEGTIGVFSSDIDKPYNRPPLSKSMWKGGTMEDVWRKTPEVFLDFHLKTIISEIDPAKRKIITSNGAPTPTQYTYDKLLYATGGSVRTLPFNAEGIIYYRTLADYRHLRKLTETKKRFLVIGGGFIGTEIAAALAITGCGVTMIFPEGSIGRRNYPPKLSEYISGYYKEKGITLISEDTVDSIDNPGEVYAVSTKNKKQLEFDAVVAGIGITPNTAIAEAGGLEVDNGVLVDEFCKSSDPNIYAAGDVANFYNSQLGKRIRIEHEDNANKMGECAGKNMAGEENAYEYLPYFYSDLFDLGYEAIGELDSRHEIVEEWKEEFKTGIIYYLDKGRIRGVLLWNVWEKIDRARKLIGMSGPFEKWNVKGLISME